MQHPCLHIYRLSSRPGTARIAWVDTRPYCTPSRQIESYIADNYLYDSADGETYVVIDSATGSVMHMFLVEATKKLVRA